MTKSVFTEGYDHSRTQLIKARKERGLTQTELADKLSKPQFFVSKYERGERRLDVVEFIEVADALGINSTTFVSNLRKWMKRRLDAR